MSTFTKRDKEVARATHRLFRSAWMQDKSSLLLWAASRPLALFIYNVLIPFQIAYALEAIIVRNFDQAEHHAWFVILFALVYCVLWAVGGWAVIRNATASMKYIQREIFANYLSKDYEFFSTTYLGTIGSQATRLREALDEYDQIIFNGFTKQVIVVTASVSIIAYQSPLLALVTVVSVAVILAFTIVVTRWRLKYRRLLSEANSHTSGVIGDALSHGTTVKSFAAEDYEKRRLNSSLRRLAEAQAKQWTTSIPADLGRMSLAALATFLLLIVTARLYEQNSIPIAIVVLVQLYVLRLIMATQDIADLIKQYEATMSTAHQAVKTMLIEPTVLDKPRLAKLKQRDGYDVAFNNVSFKYSDAPATVEAIRNLSFEIKHGERIGLVGYSGSGKTTITKLLMRFMDVTKGSISVNGVDIRDVSQKELRSLIAYVPQEPLLFHRSIAENIAYGKPQAGRRALEQVAKVAHVDEFTKQLPRKFDTLVGEKGIKLSGGQRQRVAIARALLKDAPILILDEATSSLDSKSEKFIQDSLWKLMKERTALVIAHRLSTIQRMDRIIVLHKGKIVQIGTHDELLQQSGSIYAELWAHQSGGYLGGTGRPHVY